MNDVRRWTVNGGVGIWAELSSTMNYFSSDLLLVMWYGISLRHLKVEDMQCQCFCSRAKERVPCDLPTIHCKMKKKPIARRSWIDSHMNAVENLFYQLVLRGSYFHLLKFYFSYFDFTHNQAKKAKLSLGPLKSPLGTSIRKACT